MLPDRIAPVNDSGLCRVLVVDDEPAILEDYRKAFLSTLPDAGARAYEDLAAELFGDDDGAQSKGQGGSVKPDAVAFDLVICSQGEEAVEAVRLAVTQGRPFSVAFIDVRMPPGIDGVTAAERMHALDASLNTVIVTGYSDIPRHEIAHRLRQGNFLYFQKPFLADEFMQLAWILHVKRKSELDYLSLNVSLQDQVEQRSQEIRIALQQALEGTRAKSTFLSNISHELRTPLNAIIGFSEIIQSQRLGPVGEARYVSYAADIHSSAQHLLNLINDVLDFSKIEAGAVTLFETTADIDEMITFATKLLTVKAEEKQIKLRHRRMEVPLHIKCDERRTKQVLLNLILNAIKFSHRDSAIDIVSRRDVDGGLLVDVVDAGIGMTPAQAVEALEPFTQVDGALTRSQEGTGLGLPISLALMKLHDGDLKIASEAGKGTTVTIYFPAARVE